MKAKRHCCITARDTGRFLSFRGLDPGSLAAHFVGVVLAVAGFAKVQTLLRDRSLRVLPGWPAWLTFPIAGIELVLGFSESTIESRSLNIAAAVLCGAFALLVGIFLIRGNAPACACFGGSMQSLLHAKPMNRITLLRNLALTAAAVVAVSDFTRTPLTNGALSLGAAAVVGLAAGAFALFGS